jgi:hypothetical protein
MQKLIIRDGRGAGAGLPQVRSFEFRGDRVGLRGMENYEAVRFLAQFSVRGKNSIGNHWRAAAKGTDDLRDIARLVNGLAVFVSRQIGA